MNALRVLIVEDEAIVARDIENKLKKMGWLTVGYVACGEDVLPAAFNNHPDLILMDIQLRGKQDGIETANQVRAQLDIPVIYITAHADDETLERAKFSEPFGYVLKPIDTRELAAAIQMALYKHNAEKERRRQLQRLTAMRAIDQAILTNKDLSETLNEAIHQLISQLGVDAAAVLLLNSTTENLEYTAALGMRAAWQSFYPLKVGDGLAGQVAASRQRLYILNLKNAEKHESLPWALAEGFSSYIALPMVCKGELRGVLEVYQRSELHPTAEWLDFLDSIADQIAIAADNANMLEELKASNLNLTQAYDTTIEGWSKALELRDLETRGHSERVTDLTLRLARTVGIPDKEIEHIRRGALLHDIGKMGIPDYILLKPGPLTPEEWAIMCQHPVYAAQLLTPIPFLRPAIKIPLHHHEHWNGNGYPDRLSGEQIPLEARLFAVVDVWDALRSDRPYKHAWPEAEIITYIKDQSGKHFDPEVLQAFWSVVQPKE